MTLLLTTNENSFNTYLYSIPGSHKPRTGRVPSGSFWNDPGLSVQPPRHVGQDVRSVVRLDVHAAHGQDLPPSADAVHAGRRRPARPAPHAQVAEILDSFEVSLIHW